MKGTLRKLFSVLLLCSVLCTGCSFLAGPVNSITSKLKASTEPESVEAFRADTKGSSDGEKTAYLMQDLNEVTEQCLELTDPVNSCGYPLDESFYLWFYGEYGEGIYRKLYERMKEGTDSDIYRKLTGNTLHVLWMYYCSDFGIHREQLQNVYVKPSENSTDIVLDFAGDINFDENWPSVQYLTEQGIDLTDCLTGGLSEEMSGADIMMLNNECTYGTGGTPIAGKAYTFQGNPERATLLKQAGVDIVSLANNHVYDYQAEGLLSTMETLKENKIPYVGAGENLDEAKKIIYFIINGKKIAITAATQVERTYNYTREATEDSAGVLKTLKPDKYVEVIREASRYADYVVAFVHWGTEGSIHYEADQVYLAKRFVEAGADVIIGGHTHCLQGVTFYEDVPVFYSLGNFWFDWEEPHSSETGLAQVIIHEDGSSEYRFLPCYYEAYKTRLLTEEQEKINAYRYLEGISGQIRIDEDGYITDIKDE